METVGLTLFWQYNEAGDDPPAAARRPASRRRPTHTSKAHNATYSVGMCLYLHTDYTNTYFVLEIYLL